MKRKIITASALMLACSSCVGCIKNPISSEKAKEIALNHANLSNSEVVFVKSEMDFDNGMKAYDVEFYHDSQEYDYKIDAMNGTVLEYDNDVEDYIIPQTDISSTNSNNESNVNNSNTNASDNNTNAISEVKAKEIALNHAQLSENDVTFIKSNIDYDDGMNAYDVEFYHNFQEYDYKIDANSGAIIEFDNDVENYMIPQQSNNNSNVSNSNLNTSNTKIISDSKAKEIALKHANLSSNQVQYLNAHLDIDDGMQVYDVNFYANNVEHSYEIDAQTGKIVSYDVDSMYD